MVLPVWRPNATEEERKTRFYEIDMIYKERYYRNNKHSSNKRNGSGGEQSTDRLNK